MKQSRLTYLLKYQLNKQKNTFSNIQIVTTFFLRNILIGKLGLFSFSLLLLGCGEAWQPLHERITTAGAPAKRLHIHNNIISPKTFDVSVDNKVYFSYYNEKGRSICGMDIYTGKLIQITEDGNNDFHPVVSHSGKTILFKRGALLGGGSFYTVNSNGLDCKLLLNKNIYLTNAVFSLNDSTIYFVGGALFSDTNEVESIYPECQDIFAIDVNGKNFRRITRICVTSWIYDIILMPDGNHLFISFGSESAWEKHSTFTYIKTNYAIMNRKPYSSNFNGVVNLTTGELKEININVSRNYYFGLKEVEEIENTKPYISNSAKHPTDNYVVFKENLTGIFKFDYKVNTISLFIDSINNTPSSLGHYPDSLDIYNFKFMYGQEKLVAGVSKANGDDYKLVLFDIKSKHIEKQLPIDTNNFIPSPHRTIFRDSTFN